MDSFSAILHPHNQGLDFIPNSSNHKPSEDNSSVASESLIICLKTQNSCNMESMSSFEFTINYKEWALISPHSNENKLKKELKNIFSKISKIHPYCVIQILYHRINRYTATLNSCYFVAEPNCKFKNCIRLNFSIDNIPTQKKNIFLLKSMWWEQFLINILIINMYCVNVLASVFNIKLHEKTYIEDSVRVSSP